jgi:uncharacterized membrane protein YhaH (DUF805 family)
MASETLPRCPVCATPLKIPRDAVEFRCPFCTKTLYVEYDFTGVKLHKEQPQAPAAPPPSEFEQLLARASAPRPSPWRVWQNRLFGFGGRISRKVYWVGFAVGVPLYFIANWLARRVGRATPGPSALTLALLGLALLALGLWLWLAVSIKRYHDRNKSGWWVLIALIPYIGTLWQVVELGFFAGNPGPNRFGEIT